MPKNKVFGQAEGEGNQTEDCGRYKEMNPDGLTKKI